VKPTPLVTPAFAAAAAISSASATERPTGFSQRICLPRAAAPRAISRCMKLGAAITTASARSSPVSQSVVQCAKPSWAAWRSASAASRSMRIVASARSGASPKTRLTAWMARPWMRPMKPAPTSAKRTDSPATRDLPSTDL